MPLVATADPHPDPMDPCDVDLGCWSATETVEEAPLDDFRPCAVPEVAAALAEAVAVDLGPAVVESGSLHQEALGGVLCHGAGRTAMRLTMVGVEANQVQG